MGKSMLNKLLVCSLLLLLAGCAENKYATTTDRLCVPAVTKTGSTSSPQVNAMKTAENVLAEMHFAIEKLDVEAGFVRTYPLSGAQTFEFWRADSVGSFNRTEADLHCLRRTVELDIGEQAGQLCINCRATTQRLSAPAGQTAIGQNHAIMSPRQRSLQKLGSEQKSNISWLDLGRDNQLETEILKRIESRLSADKKQIGTAKKGQNK